MGTYNIAPNRKNVDPYILLSEAIVMKAISDLKANYRRIKNSLLNDWPITECGRKARFAEQFFFSELYGTITTIDGKRVIKHARHSVGIDYQGGRWVLLDDEKQRSKYATNRKCLNITLLSYVYRHIRGNSLGWPVVRRNALKFHGIGKDIPESYLLEKVDKYAPGWRAKYNLQNAKDIRARLEVEGFTTTRCY